MHPVALKTNTKGWCLSLGYNLTIALTRLFVHHDSIDLGGLLPDSRMEVRPGLIRWSDH